MIIIIIIIDVPYLMPGFISNALIYPQFHLVMCITDKKYRTYMFLNNILFYSLIPFFLLLIFNCLLIGLLARQKTQLLHLIQSDNQNQSINAKRDRQFKERTILLMLVTFFLLITVSPRYIAQMIYTVINYQGLFKITLMKCLIVLEMLNFSLNFLFYIICSKTSRNELNLILYYYFYWKWSKKSRKYIICNHPNHNRGGFASATAAAAAGTVGSSIVPSPVANVSRTSNFNLPVSSLNHVNNQNGNGIVNNADHENNIVNNFR